MSSKTKAEVKTEAPVEVEEVKAEVPAEETRPEKKGNLVYLGPTITGVVRHSDVFEDGVLPERTQKCVADFPMMERLFVQIDRKRQSVDDTGTQESKQGTAQAQKTICTGEIRRND